MAQPLGKSLLVLRSLPVALLLLAASQVAYGQATGGDDLKAKVLSDLAAHIRDARKVVQLPSPGSNAVELVGPPRLRSGETPVCAVSILRLEYSDGYRGGQENMFTGFSTFTKYRLAVENDSKSATEYTHLLRACEAALSDQRSRWFWAKFEDEDWSLFPKVVWKVSGLLSAIRGGVSYFDGVSLVDLRRQSEGRAIQALEHASGQDMSFLGVTKCADSFDDCRLISAHWEDQLMLQVTYRRDAEQRWSITAANAHWNDMVSIE